jgi:cytochrome P450
MCYAAANRDPKRFADAEKCLIDRRPNPHLAFGSGPHTCLGAHLARAEIRVALEEVLRVMPDYRLDPDGSIEYTPHGDLRGFWKLPARIS